MTVGTILQLLAVWLEQDVGDCGCFCWSHAGSRRWWSAALLNTAGQNVWALVGLAEV